MKAKYFAFLFVFISGLVCGNWSVPWGQHEALAQDQSTEEETIRDLGYEEAELKLMEAQLAWVNRANEKFGGGIYSPVLIRWLELKGDVLRTYLDEQRKAEPNMQTVLITLAEARLEVAKLELDREADEEKRPLRELTVEVAEERLKGVKSDRIRDAEYRQNWLIRQLELDLLGVRLDLELAR
jgi:hypothetical protein